jgi:hypothetical protein
VKVRIRGLDGLSWSDVERELAAGGRFVFFEACVSVCVLSFRWPSDVVFLRSHESALWRGLPYTLITLILGWWAVPWGVIFAPRALLTNLRGGRDVTAQVLAQWPVEDEPTPAAP